MAIVGDDRATDDGLVSADNTPAPSFPGKATTTLYSWLTSVVVTLSNCLLLLSEAIDR